MAQLGFNSHLSVQLAHWCCRSEWLHGNWKKPMVIDEYKRTGSLLIRTNLEPADEFKPA